MAFPSLANLTLEKENALIHTYYRHIMEIQKDIIHSEFNTASGTPTETSVVPGLSVFPREETHQTTLSRCPSHCGDGL